jgi:hypothetical protein
MQDESSKIEARVAKYSKIKKARTAGRKSSAIPKVEKRVTFGKMITDADVARNSGFVYMITIVMNNETRVYIGKKSFAEAKNPWQTYTSSSKMVNGLIKANYHAVYTVIQLCNTKQSLNALENKLIVQSWSNLNKTGELHKSLNFAVGKQSRARVLKVITSQSQSA